MRFLITYNEAVEKIIIKINESQKTLQAISEESGVSYDIVSLIKNRYKKPYPNSVQKLLKYFKIEAKKVTAYELREKSKKA